MHVSEAGSEISGRCPNGSFTCHVDSLGSWHALCSPVVAERIRLCDRLLAHGARQSGRRIGSLPDIARESVGIGTVGVVVHLLTTVEN
jgi:hypothetical protein